MQQRHTKISAPYAVLRGQPSRCRSHGESAARYARPPSLAHYTGTVVDSDVCHPFAFDFYLQVRHRTVAIRTDCSSQAHAGLQGTARPTH